MSSQGRIRLPAIIGLVVLGIVGITALTIAVRNRRYARLPRLRLVLQAQPEALFEFSLPELPPRLPEEESCEVYAQIASRLAPEALGTAKVKAIDLRTQRLTIRTLATDDEALARQAQKAQALLADLFPDVRLLGAESHPVTLEDLERVRDVLQARLRGYGVARSVVQLEPPDRLVVEIPTLRDPERAQVLIRQSAILEFRHVPRRYAYGDDHAPELSEAAGRQVFTFRERDGNEVPTRQVILGSPVILTGSDLKPNSAQVVSMPQQATAVVFALAPGPATTFERFTREHINHYLAVVLDGEMITCPFIREAIPGGKIQITGGFDAPEGLERARELRILLNAGALPLDLEYVESHIVEPPD